MMKKILIVCFIVFGFTGVYAQNDIADSAAYYDKIFLVAQQNPNFSGDKNKWLSDHIVYPQQAADSNIQGTVYISFVIEKDGSVSNVKVLRGVERGSTLDREAVRVMSAMPKWTPGIENGHIVRVQSTLPVNFKLYDKTDTVEGYSYGKVEIKPVFPGNVMEWLAKNIAPPKMIIHGHGLDTVYVSFIVEKDGSVSHMSVVKGVDRYLDREAVWVVSKMPKWKPGLQKGQPVRVICVAPVPFVLYDNSGLAPPQNCMEKPVDTIYIATYIRIIREFPRFPGDLNKWLMDHIVYPEKAKDANTQGTVFISFVVEKDGSVSSIKILRGVNSYLNNEALRVVSTMPKWSPGKVNGIADVRDSFTLPIHFILK